MTTRQHAESITAEKETSPSPMTVGLQQAMTPTSPSPPSNGQDDTFPDRMNSGKRRFIASAWDDAVGRSDTERTDTEFPERAASVSVSNMVILNDYDENLMTAQRMQTFVDAFPNRAATARSVVQRMETERLGFESMLGSGMATPTTGGDRAGSVRGSTGSMIKNVGTMHMLRRPSALPSKAEDGQLQWRNVNIFVGDGAERRQILRNFTGQIKVNWY